MALRRLSARLQGASSSRSLHESAQPELGFEFTPNAPATATPQSPLAPEPERLEPTPPENRPPPIGSTPDTALTVSRLTNALRYILEDRFPNIWVIGEISNSRPAASGHYYFTLKDSAATLQAVLFRSDAARVTCPLPLKDGQSVLARGRLTIYESRGQYQLQILDLRPYGQGILQQRFEELKARLLAEGLFARERKRPLPIFPEQIGIVTSLQGAVLHDLTTVLARRAPGIRILVRGVRVQGPEAAPEIARAIRDFADDDIDLLIVARGGGSLEDLWPFNEEMVARALADSPMPTVSAVGHETDFSIADFVADLRAPTPSAAAEMITRDWSEWRALVAGLATGLHRTAARHLFHLRREHERLAASASLKNIHRAVNRMAQQLDDIAFRLESDAREALARRQARLPLLALRLKALHPSQIVHRNRQRLLHLTAQFENRNPRNRVALYKNKLHYLASRLTALGPQKTLDRGYALLLDSTDKPIRQPDANHIGQTATLLFSRAKVSVTVTDVRPVSPPFAV